MTTNFLIPLTDTEIEIIKKGGKKIAMLHAPELTKRAMVIVAQRDTITKKRDDPRYDAVLGSNVNIIPCIVTTKDLDEMKTKDRVLTRDLRPREDGIIIIFTQEQYKRYLEEKKNEAEFH